MDFDLVIVRVGEPEFVVAFQVHRRSLQPYHHTFMESLEVALRRRLIARLR
jgi:hypothetical protein